MKEDALKFEPMLCSCLAAQAIACAAPQTSTRVDLGPLSPDDVGGDAARAIVVFGRAGERETPPEQIDQTLLDDELMLVSRSPVACVRVTLTTQAAYDQPFDALTPTCEIDGARSVRAEVREERARPASYWYDFRPPGTWEVIERALNTVTRHGTICCPGEAPNQALRFKMSNVTMGLDDETPWEATAYWSLTL